MNKLEEIVRKTKKLSIQKKKMVDMKPMNILIVGRTGSGKTYLLLRLLENELMNRYDEIYLICPTYIDNYTYLNWEFKDLENFHPIDCDLDDIELYLELIYSKVRKIEAKTLIIMDDCACSKDVSKQKNIFVQLSHGGRHRLINTIFLTQQITSVAKSYRENLTRIITFFNPSKQDRRMLFDTMCSHKLEEEKEIMEKLEKNKYSYFDVYLEHPWRCEVVTNK